MNESSKKVNKIAIVGSPNVGKSVLFNELTGKYAIVSNYPGTTVEVARGAVKLGEKIYEIIDTPGMYSLVPVTEEERIGRRILMRERPKIIIHVADAKNLERMLQMTLQLKEASLKMILVLNMMDEARKEGMRIDMPLLQKELGLPVVGAAFVNGEGIEELKERIISYG